MGRRKEERAHESAIVETEEKFENALRLFVAHCGGDVGKATVQQRENFDSALADAAAHIAALALEAAEDDS